jgi:hypothetical protein
MPFNGTQMEQALSAAGITPSVKPESNVLASAIVSFLPIPDQDGGTERAEFWQEQGAHALQGEEPNYV